MLCLIAQCVREIGDLLCPGVRVSRRSRGCDITLLCFIIIIFGRHCGSE